MKIFKINPIPLKNENNVIYEKIDDDIVGTHHGASMHSDEIIKYDDEDDNNNDSVGANSHDVSVDEFDLDIPDFLNDNSVGTHHGASVREKDDLLDKFKMKKDSDGKLHSDYTANDDYIDESKMGDENKSVLDMMREIL